MSGLPIYLDHHATTPLDERVLEAMLPHLRGVGNADSRSHRYGRTARDAVEDARAKVASLIGARADEIVFTSGTTESNALAFRSLVPREGRACRVITQQTEHRAVLEPLLALPECFELVVLPVDFIGRVSVDAVAKAMNDSTALLSVMLANNEIGTHQPIDSLAELAQTRGVAMHVDAAQGLGYFPLDMQKTPVDLMSMSAHKIYGPQGVGALFVRRFGKARVAPVLRGGGQERGLRAGTSNVAGIVGFGEAAAIMAREGGAEATRLHALRDRLAASLMALDGHRHGDPDDSHPGNLNLRFEGISADRLLVEVEPELALSTGSACSSGGKPSHVLIALGLDENERRGALRIGLGRTTTSEDVDHAIAVLESAIRKLRGRSLDSRA